MASAIRYSQRHEKIKKGLNETTTAGLRNVGRVVQGEAVLNVRKNGR
jgi:ribosomal protein L7Ae-like RNA K-turn-binding protein